MLPFALCCGAAAAWLLGLARDALFVPLGAFAGWAYLRYLQPSAAPGSGGAGSADDGFEFGVGGGKHATYGDVSDGFAFETLFPPPLRRWVAPPSAFCYVVALLCGFHAEVSIYVTIYVPRM